MAMECPGVKLSWGCFGETIAAISKVGSCHEEFQGQVTLGPGAVPKQAWPLRVPGKSCARDFLDGYLRL